MKLRPRLLPVLAVFPISVAAVTIAATAHAQDAGRTRLLAANCANCHGTEGRSQGGVPALAGLSKDYIVQQMQDFRSGKRVATIMHQLSKGYSDAEIDSLAAYFAAQPK